MDRWDKFFMDIAIRTAKESKCKKKKVGAVIVKDKRILSNGYNGTPSGWNNQEEFECEETLYLCPFCKEKLIKLDDISYSCKNCEKIIKKPITQLITKHEIVIHAEMNAIAFAAKYGISIEGCSLYVTMAPCPDCAKLIVQSGIKEVIYLEEYKKRDGIIFLKNNNIIVRKI